jgi:hypothetical protein
MNRRSILILIIVTCGLAAVLSGCGRDYHRPGSATIGVAQVDYQSWSCEGGLILFHDAMIGNEGEVKDHYEQWLSPIPCHSAGLYLVKETNRDQALSWYKVGKRGPLRHSDS